MASSDNPSRHRRRRSQSRSKDSRRGVRSVNSPSTPSPYIRRQLNHFNPLDEVSLTAIENQTDWIIQDVGIAFRDDPVALETWREAGAKVDGDTIRASADWIRELCSTAPSEFIQRARNPSRSVTIGGDNQVFAPIYGAPFVRDVDKGRRYGDMQSFHELVKLTYMHPNLHHGGFVTCEPCDVPVSDRHLDMLLAHMTLSDKPHLGAITEMSRAQDSVDMAEIVFGKEDIDKHCVIMGNVNTNSPLLVDKVVTQAIRVYCGRGTNWLT